MSLNSSSLPPDLCSPDWLKRNRAIKTLTAASHENSLALLAIITDRRPSPLWKKIVGESYYQVGFIRRNAWRAMAQQSLSLQTWNTILPLGLHDPYWEVRSACLDCLIRHIKRQVLPSDFVPAESVLQKLLRERSFEVIRSGLHALAYLQGGERLLEHHAKFSEHPDWIIREAFVEYLQWSLEQGRITGAQVRSHLDPLNPFCAYFRPIFSLQERRRQLEACLDKLNPEESAP